MSLRYIYIVIVFSYFGVFMLFASDTHAKSTWSYPRLANYFLDEYVTVEEAEMLARWDVVILSPEVQDFEPRVFDVLRTRNPDIIILAYVSSIGVRVKPVSEEFPSLRPLSSDTLPDEWFLKSSHDKKLNYWPNTYMLNVTDVSPAVQDRRWNTWLPEFIAESIYANGYWDGIFIDETFDSISWINGGNIDLNRDGVAEEKSTIDTAQLNGMKKLLNNLRQRVGNSAYIVVNGSGSYTTSTNGRMHENAFIDNNTWHQLMAQYRTTADASMFKPLLPIINANTGNSGNINIQHMLFSFASTLLEDGFFSYDFGDTRHMNIWQFDEYGHELGLPYGDSYNMLDSKALKYSPGLWRRDFDNGVVLVNTTQNEHVYRVALEAGESTGRLAAYSAKIINGKPIRKILPPPQPPADTAPQQIVKQPNRAPSVNNDTGKNPTAQDILDHLLPKITLLPIDYNKSESVSHNATTTLVATSTSMPHSAPEKRFFRFQEYIIKSFNILRLFIVRFFALVLS